MNTPEQPTKYGLANSVADWMTQSGIQAENGGVYAWFDMQSGKYSYLYSEITGYAITAFLYMHKLYGSGEYLERAEKAARWITEHALSKCGGVLTRQFVNEHVVDESTSFTNGNIYSFDTGMVLYGFAELYKATGKEAYLKHARTMADFLVDTMQNEDGSFAAIYNEETGIAPNSTKKWSTQQGSFHAKIAIGLTSLFEITKDEKYKTAAITVCRFALTRQDSSGRFITDDATRTTNLHPHCYSIEGLSYTGATFGIDEFSEAAEKATYWMLSRANEGGINEVYDPARDSFSDFQRSDIVAQVLRAGLLFVRDENLDDLVRVLLAYRCDQDGDGEKDGFFYSRNDEHVNFWCTMFAFQALALYYDRSLLPRGGERLNLLI